MNALILAAGRGSRLKKHTEAKPKCLNMVSGKTLLQWQISSLNEAGLENINILTGYLKEMLEKTGYKTINNPRWKSTNMVQSLMMAEELFTDDLIVSYSDIIFGPEIVKKLINSTGDIVLSYDINWKEYWDKRFENIIDDAETFRIDKNGYIFEIGRKITNIKEVQGQYMGLMKFSKDGLKTTRKYINSMEQSDTDKLDMTSLFNILLNNGEKILGVPNDELWCEIDSEKDLRIANQLLSN